MKILDRDHPFFAPLWRRIVIVGATIAWAGFEFWAGSETWGFVFLAIGLYGAYEFFILFEPKGPDDDEVG